MAKSEPQPATRRYHHGNLRRELLRIARQELAQHGVRALSISALSRLAKVSQAAPYRHFADLNGLLEALAAEGFEGLHDAVAKARGETAEGRLARVTSAYVAFGEANRELYRLMFASRLVPDAKSGSVLERAADRAFAQLREVVAAHRDSQLAQEEALLVWAQLHGLVMLKADGLIERSLVDLLAGSPRSLDDHAKRGLTGAEFISLTPTSDPASEDGEMA